MAGAIEQGAGPLIVKEDFRYEVEYRKGKDAIIARSPNLADAKDLFEWAALKVGLITPP